MEQKKGFSEKLEAFFAGKGFYIVLLLSAAVIGASIWMTAAGRADVENGTDGEPENITQANVGGQTAASEPAAAPAEEPGADIPVMAEAQAPAVEQEMGIQPTLGGGDTDPAPADYFVWPVSGAVERGYSVETLSYDRTLSDWRTHAGWDIAADLGTQVLAAGAGTVTAVYAHELYGTTVEIDHGNGLMSVSANLAAVPTVNVGDQVTVGQVIGAVGDTALCEIGEACHLHFAMRLNGMDADPGSWLPPR